jgi:transcriptional regulator with XRE-family HTH domain
MSVTNEMNLQFGRYLQEKRLAVGLTQFEIARKLGYGSPQFISNIERGVCFPPNKVLRGMIKHYKMPVQEVLDLLTKLDRQRWRKAIAG